MCERRYKSRSVSENSFDLEKKSVTLLRDRICFTQEKVLVENRNLLIFAVYFIWNTMSGRGLNHFLQSLASDKASAWHWHHEELLQNSGIALPDDTNPVED